MTASDTTVVAASVLNTIPSLPSFYGTDVNQIFLAQPIPVAAKDLTAAAKAAGTTQVTVSDPAGASATATKTIAASEVVKQANAAQWSADKLAFANNSGMHWVKGTAAIAATANTPATAATAGHWVAPTLGASPSSAQSATFNTYQKWNAAMGSDQMKAMKTFQLPTPHWDAASKSVMFGTVAAGAMMSTTAWVVLIILIIFFVLAAVYFLWIRGK